MSVDVYALPADGLNDLTFIRKNKIFLSYAICPDNAVDDVKLVILVDGKIEAQISLSMAFLIRSLDVIFF